METVFGVLLMVSLAAAFAGVIGVSMVRRNREVDALREVEVATAISGINSVVRGEKTKRVYKRNGKSCEEHVFDICAANPGHKYTTKHLSRLTGYGADTVRSATNRLVSKGFIQRVDFGVYRFPVQDKAVVEKRAVRQ